MSSFWDFFPDARFIFCRCLISLMPLRFITPLWFDTCESTSTWLDDQTTHGLDSWIESSVEHALQFFHREDMPIRGFENLRGYQVGTLGPQASRLPGKVRMDTLSPVLFELTLWFHTFFNLSFRRNSLANLGGRVSWPLKIAFRQRLSWRSLQGMNYAATRWLELSFGKCIIPSLCASSFTTT